MTDPRRLSLYVICTMALAAPAAATVYELTPADDWYGVVSGSALQPGDQVILHEGVYSTSFWLPIDHQGTAESPIIIRAAEGETAVITKTVDTLNNIDMHGAQYVTLRGLEITGADAAIRIMKDGDEPARFVTIEDCHIHHTGGNGITCNHPDNVYEGMVFRGNEIHHTGGHGEAFYLGANNDENGQTVSVFRDGLIEKNYIHDLDGPTIIQGDGIEIKDGSYNNVVRDNVIINTNYPGIIVYGTDGHAPNVIERNVVIGTNDNGIQAAAEAVVRNNIVMGAAYSGIASHDHQSAVVGNLEICHNTVFASPGEDTIHIYTAEGPSGPITVANNALHNGSGGGGISVPGATVLAGNVVSTDPDADFGDVANWDFFPIPGSAVIVAGSAAYVAVEDFNGSPREGAADAGAYLYDPYGNPGWEIAEGFKLIPIPIGDATKDGLVDGADYTAWADHYEQSGGWSQGDFNGDHTIDGADYTAWADNYGNGCVTGNAIPEPAGLLVMTAAGFRLLLRRKRSARRNPELASGLAAAGPWALRRRRAAKRG